MSFWDGGLIGLVVPLFFASTTIQTNICGMPSAPILSMPTTAITTVATVTFAGTTTPSSTVTITDNGQPAAVVTSDGAGIFQVQLALAAGRHAGTVQASNACGASSVTPFTVTVSPTVHTPSFTPGPTSAGKTASPLSPSALSVRITEPAANQTVPLTVPSVLVVGTTNLAATETVTDNGVLAATILNPNISFRVRVALVPGGNTIEVHAVSSTSTAAASVVVTRLPAQQPNNRSWYTLAGRIAVLFAALLGVGAGAFILRLSLRRGTR